MKIDPQIRHLTKPGANLFLERKLLQHRPLLAWARAIGEPGMGGPLASAPIPRFAKSVLGFVKISMARCAQPTGEYLKW